MSNKSRQQALNVKKRKAKSREKAAAEHGSYQRKRDAQREARSTNLRRNPFMQSTGPMGHMFLPFTSEANRDANERQLSRLLGGTLA